MTPEAMLIKGSCIWRRRTTRELWRLSSTSEAAARSYRCCTRRRGGAAVRGSQGTRSGTIRAELAINPRDFNANAFLGWLVQQDGESDRALELLQAAYDQNEDDTGVQYLLAQVHSSRGSWREAESLLEEVIKVQPGFIPAHVMLARAYAKLSGRSGSASSGRSLTG